MPPPSEGEAQRRDQLLKATATGYKLATKGTKDETHRTPRNLNRCPRARSLSSCCTSKDAGALPNQGTMCFLIHTIDNGSTKPRQRFR